MYEKYQMELREYLRLPVGAEVKGLLFKTADNEEIELSVKHLYRFKKIIESFESGSFIFGGMGEDKYLYKENYDITYRRPVELIIKVYNPNYLEDHIGNEIGKNNLKELVSKSLEVCEVERTLGAFKGIHSDEPESLYELKEILASHICYAKGGQR